MTSDLPKSLKRGLWCQVLGILLLCLSLLVGTALPFVVTIGGGCTALALGVMFFFLYYAGTVASPSVDEGTGAPQHEKLPTSSN